MALDTTQRQTRSMSQNSRYLIPDFMNHHTKNERTCNAQKEYTILNASRAPLISVDTRSSPISIHALNIKKELILKLPGSKTTITLETMLHEISYNYKYFGTGSCQSHHES